MRRKRFLLAACVLMAVLLCSACANEEVSRSDTDAIQMPAQKLDENGLTEDAVNQVMLQPGKSWGDLEIVGTEDAVYCNLQTNVKSLEEYVILCPDPVYGITYYVNYGYDYFIYAQKDGICEQVVKLPARRLFCRGGKLYFLVDSYSLYTLEGVQEGNICEYDPVTGEVTVIIADLATSMVVYQEGIYYKKILTEEATVLDEDQLSAVPTEQYRYLFADGQTEAVNIYNTLCRWNDSFLVTEIGPYVGDDEYLKELAKEHEVTMPICINLESLEGAEQREMEGLPADQKFRIYQDQIHYIEDSGTASALIRYDINEMTAEELQLNNEEKYNDYVICGNELLFSDLLTVPLDGSAQSRGYTEESIAVYELYTDGTEIYAICGRAQMGIEHGKIMRLEKDPDEEKKFTSKAGNGVDMEFYGMLFLETEGVSE